MSRLAFIAAAIATGLAFQTPAAASTVSFETTLDLSAPSYFSSTGITSFAYWDGFSGFVPNQVGTGDQVNVKYTFANGVGVSASSISYASAYILDFDRNTGNTADGRRTNKSTQRERSRFWMPMATCLQRARRQAPSAASLLEFTHL
jgi:hypothetical protein